VVEGEELQRGGGEFPQAARLGLGAAAARHRACEAGQSGCKFMSMA
jgi:hypothetical protein